MIQYLVEVKNKDVNKVPSDWTRISGYGVESDIHDI